MPEGDLNARPESIDEGWHRENRNAGGGVSAGKIVNWLVLLLVLAAVGYLGYSIARDFLPRWWAEQVGMETMGNITRGTILGLIIGSIFTFVPLLLLAQARRRFFSWAWRGSTSCRTPRAPANRCARPATRPMPAAVCSTSA